MWADFILARNPAALQQLAVATAYNGLFEFLGMMG